MLLPFAQIRLQISQGYPLSPTLFGLSIDKLEKVVNRVAREEGLDVPKLMQQVMLLFKYMQMTWLSFHMMLMVCNVYLEHSKHFAKVADE